MSQTRRIGQCWTTVIHACTIDSAVRHARPEPDWPGRFAFPEPACGGDRMHLLTLEGNETRGQLVVAARNLRHTQLYVGYASTLGMRIREDLAALKPLIREAK